MKNGPNNFYTNIQWPTLSPEIESGLFSAESSFDYVCKITGLYINYRVTQWYLSVDTEFFNGLDLSFENEILGYNGGILIT